MSTASFATFECERDLDHAVRLLRRRCPILRAVHTRTGTPALRTYSADFAGLAKIVTGQQLSAESAAAIWSRVAAGVGPFNARRILKMREAQLAKLGLSRPKIKTLKALAGEVAHDGLDFDALNASDDEAIMARLTALHGIGPWSAEIYLLFALRRADSFPSGDLALQTTAQGLFGLKAKPSADGLLKLAERWRPWRGAAAHLLWAEYALRRRKPLKEKENHATKR